MPRGVSLMLRSSCRSGCSIRDGAVPRCLWWGRQRLGDDRPAIHDHHFGGDDDHPSCDHYLRGDDDHRTWCRSRRRGRPRYAEYRDGDRSTDPARLAKWRARGWLLLGSGSLIRDDGLILTNAHLVENDPTCPYDTIGIAVLEAADQPPTLSYVGDLLIVDQALDLAVVKISADLEGRDVDAEFPYLSLGDSEEVDLGDPIRVLGYPAIGGDTITLTRGAVSGFTEQRDIDGRAWIKTDATISGGNSGGVAVDDDGQLIGVPTIAGSGANVDPTDCRAIQDTNGDGFLDDRDSCVPIGGFINGLRPVNLALSLIADADGATPIVIEPATVPEPPVVVVDAVLGSISFSTGVDDRDEPIDEVDSIPSGVTERVCGFWDYDGMVDGTSFDALWYFDGVFIEDASILDTEWFGGLSGNWWVCFIGSEAALDDGTYELVLNVQGELAASEAIVVGGDGSVTEFELVNETGDQICFVMISLSDAQNWGPDELGDTETIPAGVSRVFEMPPAFYDLRALDCARDVIVEDFVLDITETSIYNVAG